MSERASRPIGVFDSGVGGLTVVKQLLTQLPDESILYFGDTARVPYGPKSPQTVRRYAREAASFLLSQDVKMVIVACNTAAAHACDALMQELSVPVLGVIEPGARAATAATKTGRIGVVGTVGTIASGAYDWEVRRRLPGASVFAQSCPLFVPLVEEGLAAHDATRLIACEYLRPLQEVNVDVVILGCTHYPLLESVLADILGPDIALVDSAAEAAADARRALEASNLLRSDESPAEARFFVSDSPLRFLDVGRRFLGDRLCRVDRMDLEGYDLAA
jgi:glutamate racemase